MNRREILTRIALAGVPLAAAGVAFSYFFVAATIDMERLISFTFVLATLALALSVEAGWLAWAWIADRPRLRRMGRQRDFLQRRSRFLEGRLAILEEDMEVLSAMRQVARATAAHDGLDRVLEETLKIVQELVGADWVTIFVHDPKANTLVPRAHRRGKTSFLGPKVPPEFIDDTNVRAAFHWETVMKTVEGDRLQAAIPALTGGDNLGVVAVSAPLRGTSQEKAQRVEVFENALRDIAEHIAYALRATSLQTRALVDDLTGLGNRGLFDERLGEMAALALRKNQPLSLVLIDIDHFKNVNDTCGHQMGDRVLRDVAGVLAKSLRRYDSAYRYGGEEMAILLPQTEIRDAARMAERVRARLERRSFGSRKLRVTASFGVASLCGDILNEEALIAAADAQVYKAKQSGRNRVEPASLVETADRQ